MKRKAAKISAGKCFQARYQFIHNAVSSILLFTPCPQAKHKGERNRKEKLASYGLLYCTVLLHSNKNF
jgi:hypothetical protein